MISPASTDKTYKKVVKKKKEEVGLPEESKVGKKLSDLTIRRVIILVLAMLFSVILFSVSTYELEPLTYDYGL